MTNIDKIEQSWSKAKSIQFYPTRDYKKEPPVIAIVFDKQGEGADGYNVLLDTYKNKETTLIIFNKGTKIDISVVSKDTADSINIKNLDFDQSQLNDFLEKEIKDRRFVFVIGFLDNMSLVFTATRQSFSPLVIDKYDYK